MIFPVGTIIGQEDADAICSLWLDDTPCIFSITVKEVLNSEDLTLIKEADGYNKYQNKVAMPFRDFCIQLSEITGKEIFESNLANSLVLEKICE